MFTTGLDLLYWQPHEDGLPYVMEQNGEVKNGQMKWGWGFRLAFEYGFDRDIWDVKLSWTCLPIQKDTETSGHLFPYWTQAPIAPGDFVDHAKAHWRLHLGIVDLELRRACWVSHALKLTPRLGVRFASIRQKYYVTYSGGSLFPDQEDHFNTKNKFWGVGPETGIDLSWHLGGSWNILGQIGGALAYGQIYVHDSDTTKPSNEHHEKLFNIFQYCVGLWDMALGLEWLREDYSIYALWEQHLYPSQNQLSPLISSSARHLFISNLGDLSLIGITVGAKWTF